MKFALIFVSVLVGCLGLADYVMKAFPNPPCWCWSAGQGIVATPAPPPKPIEAASPGSYGTEVDWNNPEHIIPLDYNQEQGKQIFYQQCVWCHSDTTPAGPSNRSNVTPTPPLMNDGAVFNEMSDASLRQVIALGGRASGHSAMMPPYGKSLTQGEIWDLIAYMRAIAVPAYDKSSARRLRGQRRKPL